MPLPQVSSDRHVPAQPSPLNVLPSSQTSRPSTTPLPQFETRHAPARQTPVPRMIVQLSPSAAPLHALRCSGDRHPYIEHVYSAGQKAPFSHSTCPGSMHPASTPNTTTTNHPARVR